VTEVSPAAPVVLDGSGNGQVSLGPAAGTKWTLRLATVSVSSSTRQPTCKLYRGSSSGPLELVDSTNIGAGASSAKVGGAIYYSGQLLWAVWSGGDAGAVATLQAYGTQTPRGAPLSVEPLGEGFPSIQTSITIPTGATTGARIVIGSDIPPELLTWAAGNGATISAVILEYWSTTDYQFIAVGQIAATPEVWRGFYTVANGVFILEVDAANGVNPNLNWGYGANTGTLFVNYSGAVINISGSPADIQVNSHSMPRGIPVVPTASSSTGTATSGTTETRDAVLGDYQFTAVTNRRYRIMYTGLIGNGSVAADTYAVNIRDGGSSTPTAASPLVATVSSWPVLVVGTGGRLPIFVSDTVTPAAGVRTLGAFAVRNSGTGVFTPVGTRSLYVEDIGSSV
jgi:hypothetical protein